MNSDDEAAVKALDMVESEHFKRLKTNIAPNNDDDDFLFQPDQDLLNKDKNSKEESKKTTTKKQEKKLKVQKTNNHFDKSTFLTNLLLKNQPFTISSISKEFKDVSTSKLKIFLEEAILDEIILSVGDVTKIYFPNQLKFSSTTPNEMISMKNMEIKLQLDVTKIQNEIDNLSKSIVELERSPQDSTLEANIVELEKDIEKYDIQIMEFQSSLSTTTSLTKQQTLSDFKLELEFWNQKTKYLKSNVVAVFQQCSEQSSKKWTTIANDAGLLLD